MASWLIFFGIFGLWWQIGCGKTNKYDNHTLIRLYPTNEDQMGALFEFQDPEGQVEVLKSSRGYNDSLDVLVPSARRGFMEDFMRDTHMISEIEENYGRKFDAPHRSARRVLRSTNVFQYNSFAAMQEYIVTLAGRHPELVELQNLGTSYQGRKMTLVKISSNPSAGNPIIFIDAGIHAREWVAPAMAFYLIHRLTNDPEAKNTILNGVDWYILPVVNPDGYEYSRSNRNNRMWRKTRSKNANCYGVDGNRNYGFKWAVSGISFDPCNGETYAGPNAFSEPETQMVRKVMMENAKKIKLYVSLHSYGQYLVYPWGYTGNDLPKEWKKLDSLAKEVSNSVQRAGGKPFRVLSAGNWYPAAGGSDDYAFGAIGIPYSYTMELTDGFEFIFPESLLKKVLPEFYEGFKTFAAHIKKEFRTVRKPRDDDTSVED